MCEDQWSRTELSIAENRNSFALENASNPLKTMENTRNRGKSLQNRARIPIFSRIL